MTAFKRPIAGSRVRVVLSSTWRYDPAGLFSAHYLGINYVDVIPDLPNRPRREEILAWLAKHPEVARYAVIDDDDDGSMTCRYFNLPVRPGLAQRIADVAMGYLQGKTDEDMRRGFAVRLLQNVRANLKLHPG